MLMSHSQIIHTEGSYSFLLCGVTIACIGFILFIGLLLFQRMHRNYLRGTVAALSCTTAHSLFSPIVTLLKVRFILTGTSKKSTTLQEPVAEQNGSAKTEQKEDKERS